VVFGEVETFDELAPTMLVMFNVPLPLLVRVMSCEAEVVPTI